MDEWISCFESNFKFLINFKTLDSSEIIRISMIKMPLTKKQGIILSMSLMNVLKKITERISGL